VAPDGDTLGASLALAEALRALGKTVCLVCSDAVPAFYAFLSGAGEVVTPDAVAGAAFDLAVAVDVSDYARLDSAQACFDAASCRLVIDHHSTNDRFGQINWIEPKAAATGVMVRCCIAALGAPLTETMSECLYVAISTDSGNFSFSNTDAEAMRAAADLIDAGVHVHRLTQRLYHTRSRQGVELLARALSSLRFHAGQRIALMALTAKDFAQTGAADSMTEGIVSYAIEITGVRAAALVRESKEGVRCSLRARVPFDVSRVAQAFGGGGHALAAGCTLPFPMEDAIHRLTQALEAAL
jgi:phosphoesterase RecJ-like protein